MNCRAEQALQNDQNIILIGHELMKLLRFSLNLRVFSPDMGTFVAISPEPGPG